MVSHALKPHQRLVGGDGVKEGVHRGIENRVFLVEDLVALTASLTSFSYSAMFCAILFLPVKGQSTRLT